MEWFEQRGHNEIKVVLPRSRKDTATKPEGKFLNTNCHKTETLSPVTLQAILTPYKL